MSERSNPLEGIEQRFLNVFVDPETQRVRAGFRAGRVAVDLAPYAETQGARVRQLRVKDVIAGFDKNRQPFLLTEFFNPLDKLMPVSRGVVRALGTTSLQQGELSCQHSGLHGVSFVAAGKATSFAYYALLEPQPNVARHGDVRRTTVTDMHMLPEVPNSRLSLPPSPRLDMLINNISAVIDAVQIGLDTYSGGESAPKA
jgi:hypothetical protein